MKPVKFKETNTIFAKDQPQYLQLPAFKDAEGRVTVCYHLTIWERLTVLFKGNIWFQSLTFNKPLQPQKLSVKRPDMRGIKRGVSECYKA